MDSTGAETEHYASSSVDSTYDEEEEERYNVLKDFIAGMPKEATGGEILREFLLFLDDNFDKDDEELKALVPWGIETLKSLGYNF